MYSVKNNIQNYKWAKRTSKLFDISIHHFASSSKYTWKDAERDHKLRGWPGCAYHYVITPEGEILQINNHYDWTYHNGFNNNEAIGIALQGNFDLAEPNSKMLMALIFLINKLKTEEQSIKNLMGHKEYKNSTACPGKFIYMDLLRQVTNLKKR